MIPEEVGVVPLAQLETAGGIITQPGQIVASHLCIQPVMRIVILLVLGQHPGEVQDGAASSYKHHRRGTAHCIESR